MRILFLTNDQSGTVKSIGVDSIEETARTVFSENKNVSARFVSDSWEALVEAALVTDADIIACAGGDGTQAAIAGAIAHTEKMLLPLPCGTVNMLCRDLGFPLEIDAALRAGLAGRATKIDIGWIGDRVFLNNIVFGAYADVAEAREELRDADSLEDLSFSVVTAAEALFHADPIRFRVNIDGVPEAVETNTIMVSNNALTGAENLVPQRDQLDKGNLVVYITEAADGADFLSIISDFVVGGAAESQQIEATNCKKCCISSLSGKFSYTVDGDPVEIEQPVEIRIDSGALKVMRPEP